MQKRVTPPDGTQPGLSSEMLRILGAAQLPSPPHRWACTSWQPRAILQKADALHEIPASCLPRSTTTQGTLFRAYPPRNRGDLQQGLTLPTWLGVIFFVTWRRKDALSLIGSFIHSPNTLFLK